ncbi:MAG TPA: hypothetical protein VIK90_04255, partial [Limnochordales bacterium]
MLAVRHGRAARRLLASAAAAVWVWMGLWGAGPAVRAQADPERARALLAEADARYDSATTLEDVRQAYELYKQALQADPQSYEAAWKAGRAAWQLGELVPKGDRRAVLEEGQGYARRATEIEPDGVDGHYWYGVLIGRVGEERGVLASLFLV